AVTIDVGDPKDLHPTHKQPIGRRLALAAGTLVYGRPAAEGLSPVPQAHHVDGAVIRVTFAHAEKGLTTADQGVPRGFVVAGADGKFFPAEARIEGDSVVIQSQSVPAPVAVRYAWADNPDCNLVNAAGLPASPFRTDDWTTPALAAAAARK
ncbi:MAG TPA: sialate O-acetylesterase, partial [Opitutaceae bacterium]